MILCLLYTLQYRLVRGLFCQLHRMLFKPHRFNLAIPGHIHALRTFHQSSGTVMCIFQGIIGSDISSHNAIAFARVDLPLLRPDIKINRTDELEERIIIRLWLSFFQPLVPPDQQTHEDLDLLQCEVETDTHPLASGETDFVR
jgi:hypothetical protein